MSQISVNISVDAMINENVTVSI